MKDTQSPSNLSRAAGLPVDSRGAVSRVKRTVKCCMCGLPGATKRWRVIGEGRVVSFHPKCFAIHQMALETMLDKAGMKHPSIDAGAAIAEARRLEVVSENERRQLQLFPKETAPA